MFTSIKRIIKFGWKNFCRNGSLSLGAIFTMTVVIFLLTNLFFIQAAGQFFVSFLQEKVNISVFFEIDTQENAILEIKDELLQMAEVKRVEYISKEEALENFKRQHQDNPKLLRGLEEVMIDIPLPFPALLNIMAYQPDDYKQIVSFLEAERFAGAIYQIDYYGRELVIERVFEVVKMFNLIGIILASVFILISLFLIFHNVKLTILNQREELVVQRLIGASNWFIIGPFLVQAMIIAFFATLISLLALGLPIYLWGDKSQMLIPGFNLFSFFFNQIYFIVLVQLGIGIGLGIIASAIAIRKYLKI